jgi:hypothetical protein
MTCDEIEEKQLALGEEIRLLEYAIEELKSLETFDYYSPNIRHGRKKLKDAIELLRKVVTEKEANRRKLIIKLMEI